jgi:7,8-dihydropterin-6-yl-methyl-4-(beta-D-ribofuranosyl)aminobenzene 5'-phosphate synthase
MFSTKVAGIGAVAAAALAARYAAGRARADHDWLPLVESQLGDIGEVEEVTLLPLVERLIPEGAAPGALRGEPGVSYLVRAGGVRLLFDTGLSGGQARSALAANAGQLGIDLSALDAVVISHLHADHVGGVRAMARRTFCFAAPPLEPRGVEAYVPAEMHHDRARVVRTVGPRVVAPGVAVLPPLPRMLFWLGPVAEQALVVNVRGFGLLLLTGCGHPQIERILGVTEHVLDVPIRGVVGGLHLPVHPLGTPLVPQAVLGSPNWPWRPISERDAGHVLDEITARGPELVALSSHDSTLWAYGAFAGRFGDRYRTLRVGEELRVAAAGVELKAPGSPAAPLR